MKKRNLRPQQVAPVARETTTNSSSAEQQAAGSGVVASTNRRYGNANYRPFAAGDEE